MSKTNDGGPAENMRLRDHFAGMAMQAIVTNKQMLEGIDANLRVNGINDPSGQSAMRAMAASTYSIADAMLAAREVKP
jgi:hypothetical protein